MEDALSNYRRREMAVRRKHGRMAKGYATKLDRATGNFVQVPDNKIPAVSFRIVVRIVAVFIGFKVLLVSGLGTESYQAHLTTLAEGTLYEQVGAWFLAIDPVTSGLSELVARVIG